MTNTYQAAIFDLDGTLTDNMPFHWRAFDVFMQRHDLPPIDEETRLRLDGKRNREIMPVLFRDALRPELIAAYSDEKETIYRTLSAGNLRPLPGLLELLERIEARGVAVAVATSAPEANVGFTLEQIGIAARVRLVVRGDEVPRGKPAPDVFLEAARRLGVVPQHALVFEDALAGIEAALAAGMGCVAVTTTNSRAELERRGYQALIVEDFAEYLARHAAWLG
jgi:HAD superfamily hydrolase (TIGR01509 family)